MADILLAYYLDRTKASENSDLSKRFENWVYLELGFLTKFYAVGLRIIVKSTIFRKIFLVVSRTSFMKLFHLGQ